MNRHILLLLTDLKIGGTPTVVRELARRLHRPPAVSLHVACLDYPGPVGAQIQKENIPVTALAARGPTDLRVIARLAQLIRQERFDTVVSFLVHANAAAAVASFFCPGVHFLQSIQTTQVRPRWHWRVQRLAQHRAAKIIVPSPSVAEVARTRAAVPPEKIVVISNGVDLPDQLLVHPSGPIPRRVVFIGRLDPVKRLPDLLDAMALLNGFARLDIFGEGSERAKLAKKIQSKNLSALVCLRGSAADANQALADAELLVLPSEAEGFGLVLIEAMVAGVAVVATDAPGIRDVVKHRQTGILVPVGSPPALAAAIRWVLEDDALRQSLTAAAWADVRRRFTWDVVVDDYRRLLRI